MLVSCFDSFIRGQDDCWQQPRQHRSSVTSRNPCMPFIQTQCIVLTFATNFCPNFNVSGKPNKTRPYLWVKLTPSYRTKSIMITINQWWAFLIVAVKPLFKKMVANFRFPIFRSRQGSPCPHLARNSPMLPRPHSGGAFLEISKVYLSCLGPGRVPRAQAGTHVFLLSLGHSLMLRPWNWAARMVTTCWVQWPSLT